MKLKEFQKLLSLRATEHEYQIETFPDTTRPQTEYERGYSDALKDVNEDILCLVRHDYETIIRKYNEQGYDAG